MRSLTREGRVRDDRVVVFMGGMDGLVPPMEGPGHPLLPLHPNALSSRPDASGGVRALSTFSRIFLRKAILMNKQAVH